MHTKGKATENLENHQALCFVRNHIATNWNRVLEFVRYQERGTRLLPSLNIFHEGSLGSWRAEGTGQRVKLRHVGFYLLTHVEHYTVHAQTLFYSTQHWKPAPPLTPGPIKHFSVPLSLTRPQKELLRPISGPEEDSHLVRPRQPGTSEGN